MIWCDCFIALSEQNSIASNWFPKILYGKFLAPLNTSVTSSEKLFSSCPYGTQDSYCYGDDVVVGMNLSYFRSAGQHRLHVCNIKCPRHPSLSNPQQLCFWGHRDYPCRLHWKIHIFDLLQASTVVVLNAWANDWSVSGSQNQMWPIVVPKCQAFFKLFVEQATMNLQKADALDTSFCANLLLRQLILKMMLAFPAVAFWAWNVEMMVVVVLVVLAPLRLSWVGGTMWLLLRLVGLRPRICGISQR